MIPHFSLPLSWKNFWKSSELHQMLWLCLPALILGLSLRVGLMSQMPYAFFHDDTRHLLGTGVKWLEEGEFEISGRRTFLVPFLYAIPIKLGWPLLPTIAWGQHALGLLMVMEVGLICLLWFRSWKFWIVPLTLLISLHPSLLWYEHLALQEFCYVFGAVTIALISTWFYRERSFISFLALFFSIFLTAGARPEGNLFCLLGLGIVIAAFWRNWKMLGTYFVLGFVLSGIIFKLTPTNQGGKLLLATLMPLLPDQTKAYPALTQALKPVQEKARAIQPWFIHDITPIRKETETIVDRYLKQNYSKKDRPDADKVCKRLAIEIGLNHWYELSKIAFYKFLVSHRDTKLRNRPSALVAGSFGKEWAHEGQASLIFKRDGQPSDSWRYLPLFLGTSYSTKESLIKALAQFYRVRETNYLTRYQETFSNLLLNWRLPSFSYQNAKLPGLPLIYLISLIGFIGLAFYNKNQGKLYCTWVVMLLFLVFAIFLVGNVRARFRLVLEPFLFLGIFAFWDWVVSGFRHNRKET